MSTKGSEEIDPLESEPRPATFAERRTIAVLGGLAIVIAVGVLVRVLGSGATPVSAADELTAAPHRAAGSGVADSRPAPAPRPATE